MHRLLQFVITFILGFCLTLSAYGAQAIPSDNNKVLADEKDAPEITKPVEIKPSAQDKEIKKRLESIMQATDWYEKTYIKVNDGVVFLRGETKTAKHKEWAEVLANKTEGVVAVVNEIKIVSPASWYITEFKTGVKDHWQSFLRILPFVGVSILIIVLAWLIARLSSKYAHQSLLNRDLHPLLADVISRGVALLCILFGLYIVLQVLGLTTIALTILGGTGVLGIILGIAFRDITENLLASILLSVQKPFNNEDLIEVDNIIGYVQALTIRSTILITLDGHEVQIPNATVYKNNICNFTSNPKRRESFVVGIGYEEAISHAQEVAFQVLEKHPAVLKDPEPWILVDELAASTVNLRIYFWLDGTEYHWRKVRSSVIRLIKGAFQKANISMPGQIIELSMLDEVSVLLPEKHTRKEREKVKIEEKESSNIVTNAEGGLGSDKEELQEQGRRIERVDQEKNLLKRSSSDKT
ncbi:mechanosensitive ion channel family protein [Legionella impletisoli]|uniref:Small-conductance mechanosensitive channel n=1 Tax=Legionella impletisoli TaxID=343510 RepID=A0A917JY90_9GAMM|nr:mechanosensitive ion channel family protein [Legionella impletisoli]GGI90072.1 mechanosensitive ion channel protein MscS [Legionella impletisoli]